MHTRCTSPKAYIAYNNASPLTAPVVYGTLIYNSAGSLPTGYYVWEGAWKMIGGSTFNIVTKTTSGAIAKSETMVLAEPQSAAGWLLSLTLPQITAADNGLSITVKNTGGHRGLVSIKGFGGSTTSIDGHAALLTRYESQTFVAHNGMWLVKEVQPKEHFVFNVCAGGSWTDAEEMVEFLDEHLGSSITKPCIVRLCAGTYTVNNTLNVNYPYPVTFEGASTGHSILNAGSSLGSNPLISATTSTHIRNLKIQSYSTGTGIAIRITGASTVQYTVENVNITGFSTGIQQTNNSNFTLTASEINSCTNSGVYINYSSSASTGARIKINNNTFTSNLNAVSFNSGNKAEVYITRNHFLPGNGNTAITRNTTNFLTPDDVFINGNTWNNTGDFLSGIDLTRSDGRDASFQIKDNAGNNKQSGYVQYQVLSNTSSNTGTSLVWRKAVFTLAATSSSSSLFLVENNRFKYLSPYPADVVFYLGGTLQHATNNANVYIAITKNATAGNPGTLYGQALSRKINNNQYTYIPFSTNGIITNMQQGDYLEIWVTVDNNKAITLSDLNLLIETR